MTTETTTKPDNALAQIIDEGGLSADATKAVIRQAFAPLVQLAGELCIEAAGIVVTDATQLTEMAEAARVRKALVKVRTSASKVRDELKADALATSRVLDACARWVAERTQPVEAALAESEQFAANAEKARKLELRQGRHAALAAYGSVDDAIFATLGDIKPEAFEQMLSGAKLAKEARDAQAKKAADDAAAKAEADRVERERVNAENARLREEAKKREAAIAEERRKAESERQAAETKARKEREAIEETARKERLRLQAIADVERQKREAAEKATADRLAAEKKQRDADARKARKAAAAPDADKLRAYAKAVKAIPVPAMATEEGKAAMSQVRGAFAVLCDVIHDQAEQIGGAA